LVIGKKKGGRGRDEEGRRGWRVELSGHWMDAVDKGRRCGNPMRRAPERWKRGIGEWRLGEGGERRRMGDFVIEGRCGWREVCAVLMGRQFPR
jgi:hypothetical protein